MNKMLTFHIMTIFPELIISYISLGIINRALKQQYIDVKTYNIRDFSKNKHKKTDDYPYGGGAGMIMTVQPIYDCFNYIKNNISANRKIKVIVMSASGETFSQNTAEEFKEYDDIIMLCGRYEGIDQRAIELIGAEEISVGNFILTGGEIPALVILDATSRLIKGVLNNELSAEEETFSDIGLEYPQYTRPQEIFGKKVPEVLLNGNHKDIEQWRKQQSFNKTWQNRKDLL